MEKFKRQWLYIDGTGNVTSSDEHFIWFGYWPSLDELSSWSIVQYNVNNKIVAKWKIKS